MFKIVQSMEVMMGRERGGLMRGLAGVLVLVLAILLGVTTAVAGRHACYEVDVKWAKGNWIGMYCFDWRECSLTITSRDGTPMHLAKQEVRECIARKRFLYRGYYDHDPRDPGYWSEADCRFQGVEIYCVWHDKNGVSGTTKGVLAPKKFMEKFYRHIPPKRGAPGNRIGAGVR